MAESTYSTIMSLAPNEETQDAILEDPTVADTQTNGPATVDTSLPATSQSATPSAPIPPTQTNPIIYDPPKPFPAINTSKISNQTDPLSTTPFPPRRTCPQRHAATKALLSLSTAYEPLIIHAARSERSSSPSSATGDTGNGVSQEASGMLVIDDMLPAIDESEGDSDGYEGRESRKGRAKRVRAGMKRKRTDVRADSGRVRQRGEKRRGEKLDRDDLRLIARAAEGVMGWEERDRGTKVKKGKREEMLGGLKKDEAARLVRFVEESVDWNLAAARLSKLDIGGEAGGDGVVHGQLHTMCLEGRDMDSAAGTSHMTPCSEATTAESLKEHWRDILSKRIVDLYLE